MAEREMYGGLREALLAYDAAAVEGQARRLVEAGSDATEALNVLSSAIREIGHRFEAGEVFLPELMLAADAMMAGTAVLTPALPRGTRTSLGTVVIGAAKGDIHDIGKMIVASMLTAAGFTVIDAGVDVAPSAFIETAERSQADIIAVTAIMATTLHGQKDVIEHLEALGVRAKYRVMVGGASCTSAWAREIGADGYGEDAPEAVEVATQLMAGNVKLRFEARDP